MEEEYKNLVDLIQSVSDLNIDTLKILDETICLDISNLEKLLEVKRRLLSIVQDEIEKRTDY